MKNPKAPHREGEIEERREQLIFPSLRKLQSLPVANERVTVIGRRVHQATPFRSLSCSALTRFSFALSLFRQKLRPCSSVTCFCCFSCFMSSLLSSGPIFVFNFIHKIHLYPLSLGRLIWIFGSVGFVFGVRCLCHTPLWHFGSQQKHKTQRKQKQTAHRHVARWLFVCQVQSRHASRLLHLASRLLRLRRPWLIYAEIKIRAWFHFFWRIICKPMPPINQLCIGYFKYLIFVCDSAQQEGRDAGGLASRGVSVFDSNLRRSREGRRSPFNFRCRLPLCPSSALCPLVLPFASDNLPPGCFFFFLRPQLHTFVFRCLGSRLKSGG